MKYQQLSPDEIARLVKLIAEAVVIVPGRRQRWTAHDVRLPGSL